MGYRYLSPRREWSPAPADLLDAVRALRRLPHGTMLVADDGRVLASAHQGQRPTQAVPYTVNPVTGASSGRSSPILDERQGPRPEEAPRLCARPGCDQPARRDRRASYCTDRCRRLVCWAADNARRRPHRRPHRRAA